MRTRDYRPLASVLFDDPATPEIYTLSLHDALPIWRRRRRPRCRRPGAGARRPRPPADGPRRRPSARHPRSEEHTSELQSHSDLVCRLLLEKKKTMPLAQGRLAIADEELGRKLAHDS